MSAITRTGWVRYRIYGRGGSGADTDHWVYIPGYDDPGNETETKDYIIEQYESWAVHAEQYHIDWHYGEIPPPAKVKAEIARLIRMRKALLTQIAALRGQL